MLGRFFLIFFFLILLPLRTQGAFFDIIISEIAWMGTEIEEIESKNWWRYEWLELYNNTPEQISLENWKIELSRTDIDWSLELKGFILPNRYFLIVASDKISNYDLNYSNLGGKFNNNGQKVVLKDNLGKIIDEINCTGCNKETCWFGGDNTAKRTMERISSSASGNNASNWQTSQNPGGTPKRANGPPYQPPLPEPEPKPEPEPSPPPALTPLTSKPTYSSTSKQETKESSLPSQPAPTPQEEILVQGPETTENPTKQVYYPDGVIINEILPSPEGADAENEWIELFNRNDSEVVLSGWKIQDEEGRTTTYTFPSNGKIPANGYLILSRPTTKITLNNDGEEVTLIKPDEKVADSVVCPNAPQGQSYNRTTSDNWVWSTNLTPAKANVIFQKVSSASTSKTATTENKEETKASSLIEQGTAAIGKKSIAKTKGKPSTILIALNLALFSGITILILKRKLEEKQF